MPMTFSWSIWLKKVFQELQPIGGVAGKSLAPTNTNKGTRKKAFIILTEHGLSYQLLTSWTVYDCLKKSTQQTIGAWSVQYFVSYSIVQIPTFFSAITTNILIIVHVSEMSHSSLPYIEMGHYFQWDNWGSGFKVIPHLVLTYISTYIVFYFIEWG